MTYNNKIWVLFFKFTVLDNRSPKLIRCTWWGFFLEAQQGNGPHASSWLLLVDNNSWHGWTLAAPLISTPIFTQPSSLHMWLGSVYPGLPTKTSQTESKAHTLTQGHLNSTNYISAKTPFGNEDTAWGWVDMSLGRTADPGHDTGHMLASMWSKNRSAHSFCSCTHSCLSLPCLLYTELPVYVCWIMNERAFDVGAGPFLGV